MSSAIILAASIAILAAAYILYGSWLARKWGIDTKRHAPSHSKEDGRDYITARTPMLFGHQLTSMTGAGAVSGPVQAAVFGWLPVLLWILVGGIFFGGVQNFISLLASMRSKGKSLGAVMGSHISSRFRRVFLIFAWLFLVLTIAAFLDITAGSFAGYEINEARNTVKNAAGGSAAMAAMMMLPLAVSIGFLNRKRVNLFILTVIGVAVMGGCLIIAINFPVFAQKKIWVLILAGYLLVSSVLPVWVIQQPRDYLNSFLLYFVMALAGVGIFLTNPAVQTSMFTSWKADGQTIFPFLFLTVACGGISGFHSLIASGTVSKQLSTEKHGRFVVYGTTMVSCLFGIIVLLAVSCSKQTQEFQGSAPELFARAIGGFLSEMGVGVSAAAKADTLVLLCLTGLIFSSLDTSVRLGRYFLQELLGKREGRIWRLFSNPLVSSGITILGAGMVLVAGYQRVWPLYGLFGELTAVCALMAGACWLKSEGKKRWMIYPPLIFTILASLSTIGILIWKNVTALIQNPALHVSAGIQCVLLFFAVVFILIILIDGIRALVRESLFYVTEEEKSRN